MRLRKPCRRCRISREGRFMLRHLRGPHRICVCTSAGCDVIADVGTTSAAVEVEVEVEVNVGVGVKSAVVCRRVVGLRLKMVLSGRAGRRRGREEKDLWRASVRSRGDQGLAGQANLVRQPGCRETSRTAARTAGWVRKRRDMTAATLCGGDKASRRKGALWCQLDWDRLKSLGTLPLLFVTRLGLLVALSAEA